MNVLVICQAYIYINSIYNDKTKYAVVNLQRDFFYKACACMKWKDNRVKYNLRFLSFMPHLIESDRACSFFFFFFPQAIFTITMIRKIFPSSFTKHVCKSLPIFPAYRTFSDKSKREEMFHTMFREVLDSRPVPMRKEFVLNEKNTTETLEKLDIGPNNHHKPTTLGDKAAYYTVKTLRILPDTYFRGNHYMRAAMLETIAAVPGMVGGMLNHMKSLRRMSEDHGWISHLLHEAENERMHLMMWMKCLNPNFWNRMLVLGAQTSFFSAYAMLYILSPKTAHRMCGYLEEEAITSYTHFLNDLDSGKIENGPAPSIAIGNKEINDIKERERGLK